ncbi:hypothetical protein OCU04_008326 [Sclerotinia nivalis]|uniref:Uncharacterized protein n=1 Tax=Sclerotinia nivalis TaxID=352851 RepID=A0A9X0AI35_9HELO|nr:hypothetical protein OCU04_008326 [Sclerotinia nivalis]
MFASGRVPGLHHDGFNPSYYMHNFNGNGAYSSYGVPDRSDPSMSALPLIPKQNSVSVGLFTR